MKDTIHGIIESDKISYAVICDKFPSPHIYFNTYDEAEYWARFNQPNYRPYYIIKRTEHFEIVRERSCDVERRKNNKIFGAGKQ